MFKINQRNVCYILACLFSISTPVCSNPNPWSAPYLGFYLGGGFGDHRLSTQAGGVSNTSYFTTSADINAINRSGSWQKNPSAMIIGVQMGHDWVWRSITYGVVMDYSSLPLSSSRTVNNTYPDNTDTYQMDTSINADWLFTLRGKLGYHTTLKYPALLYLTGGMAVTKLKVRNHFTDNSTLSGIGWGESAQNQIGWAVGAGIDVLAFNHLSVNFEYLYIDIPAIKTNSSIFNSQAGFGIPERSLNSPFSTIGNVYANLLKLGLNYRFDE